MNDKNDEWLDYTKYIVKEAPSSAYYIPGFITKEEENELLRHIYDAPKPKWTQLSNRRLQNWGGLPHAKGMVAEKIPSWLDTTFKRLAELDMFDGKTPNHALVNEYLPGQGIMPHVDGPLFYPTITTINLGSHTLLDFYSPLREEADAATTNTMDAKDHSSLQSRYIGSFLLEPRSMVCFKAGMYHDYLHGIEQRAVDENLKDEKNIFNASHVHEKWFQANSLPRDTRVSLTIRHFPKTLKVTLKLGRR